MTHREMQKQIEQGAPFTLHVADGRSFTVPHIEFVNLFPKPATTISIFELIDELDPDGYDVHTIPLLMVSGVSRQEKTEPVVK